MVYLVGTFLPGAMTGTEMRKCNMHVKKLHAQELVGTKCTLLLHIFSQYCQLYHYFFFHGEELTEAYHVNVYVMKEKLHTKHFLKKKHTQKRSIL